MSRVCVVTAESHGGSQRVVLEAMACGLPVVTYGSEKNAEFVEESGNGYVAKTRGEIQPLVDKAIKQTWNTRPYVLEQWSHEIYAQNLKRGIEEALERTSRSHGDHPSNG